MVCLSELSDITMGQSPPGETYNELKLGLPFYQGTRDFGTRFPSRRVYCTAPTRLADPGDVLLSVRAPVGRFNIAPERCAVGRGVAAIRLKSNPQGFLHYALLATQNGWLKFEAEDTVFGSVSKKDVADFQVLSPTEDLVTRFGELVQPLDQQIAANWRQSQTLASLRDSLLPKLLSGTIVVREAVTLAGLA
jgi:type I restriction enzyme S subunit